ncbi:hypothetical protein EGW08_014274 [Elysia chlorotica]|uniref:Cadherin domain-containing protein n=1 Tax=Elysia chlorotica TaxID=188477 RepID=A0A3S1B7N5_ELYCH|nr:hypothetical protein EGW08_014274 [Elysia chlorotica]
MKGFTWQEFASLPSSGVPERCSRSCIPKVFTFCVLLLSLFMPSAVICQDLTYSIWENAPIGLIIGNIGQDLNLTGNDATGSLASVQYSIGAGQNGEYFRIDTASGVLYTNSSLDREQICPNQATCKLEFQVITSSGASTRTVTIAVMLLDVNDHYPHFSQAQFTVRISESANVGTKYALPTAIDDDMGANSVQSYSIRPSDGSFSVEAAHGGGSDLFLVLLQPLDREARNQYYLVLTAHDGGVPPREGSLNLTVIVDDVNDNMPFFRQLSYSVHVRENTTSGQVILILTANDPDLGVNGHVQYRLSANQADASIFQNFQVDEHTGAVTTLGPLPVGRHTLLVEAVDGGVHPFASQVDVEVTVTGAANTPPVISVTFLNSGDPWALVSEAAPLGTVVAVMTVSDSDAGPDGTVQCISQSDTFAIQKLTVNVYKVVLARQLDRETKAEFRVTLVCQDMGTPSLNTTQGFDVLVQDVNDNAPVFINGGNMTVSIQENNNINDLIALIEASDADTGQNAALQFSLLDDPLDSFHIAQGFNALLCSKVLDRESTDSYVVRVLVSDQGLPSLSATATVTISVLDVNDNAPQFLQDNYTFSIMEHSPSGVLIGNVSATDADIGANGALDFSIAPSGNVQAPFQIQADGSVLSTGPLDREKVSRVRFMAVVKDRGQFPRMSMAQVQVDILDLNDNRPVFVSPGSNSASLTLAVPVPASTVVLQVKATDADAGQNAEIQYSLTPGNSSMFLLDPLQGGLRTARELTTLDVGVYNFTLTATDSGIPYWTAQRDISITVE